MVILVIFVVSVTLMINFDGDFENYDFCYLLIIDDFVSFWRFMVT